MRKIVGILFSLILIASSLTLVRSEGAEITKPSVPGFTLKLVHHSLDQPAISTIDPYTGENITIVPAKHDEWTSIVVNIKNQPFTPYKDSNGNWINLYYNVRSKGHFSNDDWVERENVNKGYPTPSNSDYTVLDYFANYSNAKLDFQVQAMLGYIHDVQNPYGGMDNRYYPVFTGETSGWSNTQTITISDNSSTTPTVLPSPSATADPSDSPSQDPTAMPQQPSTQSGVLFGLNWEHVAIILLGVTVVVLVVALVLSHRRSTKQTITAV